MPAPDTLYSFSSLAIVCVLFIFIVGFNELGFRLGRFIQNQTDEEIKSLTGAIQASILGLLALLLGFTFSMSMQRYDSRSHALIDEVNAIGTTQLRIQLIPEQHRDRANTLLRQYIEQRIAIGTIALTELEQRQRYNQISAQLQTELWELAVLVAQDDPRPVISGTFINALNAMIDAQSKRNALLQMQVPEVVLILLFIVFISSGGILGYSSGLSGRRVIAPTLMVSFLIVLIVFIIIDLDRPKRGLIQVDQSMMQSMKTW